jgi:diguanylate cyclase (GGDEF)-like protein
LRYGAVAVCIAAAAALFWLREVRVLPRLGAASSSYASIATWVFVLFIACTFGALVYLLVVQTEKMNVARRSLYRDCVTEIGNRRSIIRALRKAMAGTSRTKPFVGLLFVEVVRLKRINEALGYAAGDAALTELARRLVQCLGGRATVARFEGDRFGIVLPAHDEESHPHAAARELLGVVHEPMATENTEITLQLRAGGAVVAGSSGHTVADLLNMAHHAIEKAKRENREKVILTELPTDPGAIVIGLETTLRNAIRNQELRVQLQPQYRIPDGRLVAAEALVRWVHPKRGVLTPSEFIPAAEAGGFVHRITECVVDDVCRILAEWQAARHPMIPVSFNLSGLELGLPRTVEMIRFALRRHRVSPSWLGAEVTESAVMRDLQATVSMLDDLQGLGISIAIDDFGTGYSSLHYLNNLPVDQLKVARQFVTNAHKCERRISLLRAILDMGRAFNLDTVAEGAESAEDVRLIRELGFDRVQGFVFGKPMWPEDFVRLYWGNGVRQQRTAGTPP